MSGRRMWSLGSKRPSTDGGRGVRYTTCRPSHDDELEDIAIVSNPDPGQVKYGSGSITANGPRVVPGIITSRHLTERLSISGTRINSGSPVYIEKTVPDALKGKSVSRQSLLDIVSSKISIGSRKRFSRDSFSASYVNRTHVASELDISRKTREARKKEIRSKLRLETWEPSSNSSDKKMGCRWTFVFDPAGRLCYYWSVVVSLAFLYNLWVMVYRFAFQEITKDTILVWFCLDYFADLIYVLDIVFHFRTGYLEDGVLQTDSRKLRQHYMNSTTFYIDCLCLLPLDFLYLSIDFKSILRCFRLVKIYKYWHFLDRTERHTNSPNLFRSISLIHYLLVIFHWNACIFYMIGKNDGFSFKPRFIYSNSSDDILEYLKAFYWCTLSLTTIGSVPLHDSFTNGTYSSLDMRTKTDYLYHIIQLMFGLLLFATVLGHIANIVTNVSAARKEFQAKLDGVKTYMRMRRVPAHLQGKVIKWFDYLWLTQKCSDEERAVSCLPDKLKAEMAIHVHLDTLKRVEIFQNTEAGFLCELVLHLRPVLFSPGDYICRKGEVGKEMYIVNRGLLHVVADNGKTMLATLKAGSYFGEISILNMGTAGNRRTASVRSVGYSDLFVLSKKDMWDVLKEYPAARVRLEAIAAKRLEKYKKAPLEKAAMGRSSSTPGLVESSGRVPLEEMWLPPVIRPPPYPIPGYSPSNSPGARSRAQRSQTMDSERQTMESALSDSSSRHSHSTDDDKTGHHLSHHHLQHPHHYHCPPTQSARSAVCAGTTMSVTSYDSVDKRSTITSPSNVISPLTSPNYATANMTYTLPVPQAICEPSISPASDHIVSAASLTAPVQLQGSHSAGALPRDSPQELLLGEIRRLRERLVTLESENATMSMKLSQQQWEVEHRLHEIEMQLCGNSSNASSNEDNERNRESII
ncbi:cyclic nucleotide-gated cation channel alpha-3-like [Penaeus chinensis]|uniref:cyclic nucleotide-gated cation channel alpha-3-like n=1 Tax=Penaeus chinensis TaxID=139456 RepID=UPI001FB70D35|nr:cyclic nucleotide-gated cation channel alpha-3-like [Penaeus chinensis]